MQKIPFDVTSQEDLSFLSDKIGNAPVIMLGEASYSTHAYYIWRAALYKKLIMEQNAFVVANAERYYRSILSFDNDSWNRCLGTLFLLCWLPATMHLFTSIKHMRFIRFISNRMVLKCQELILS